MDSTEASHKGFPEEVLVHGFVNNFCAHVIGIDYGNVDAVKEKSLSSVSMWRKDIRPSNRLRLIIPVQQRDHNTGLTGSRQNGIEELCDNPGG